MNENRQRFLDALRSGEFTQTFGEWLSHSNPTCCCAGGVAINISGRMDEIGKSATGSEIVMDFLDVDTHFVVTLICINDEQKTFAQIADWCEREWTANELPV